MKNLCILGSTGSIGTQTLEVVKSIKNIYVKSLGAFHASNLLMKQVWEFRPDYVITVEDPSSDWISSLPKGVTHLKWNEGINHVIEESDIVMNAVSGVAGIEPAYITLTNRKTLLASNKEAIVCLGGIMNLSEYSIIPVDSEHNALFQLINMHKREEIRKIWLTASGGPFFGRSFEEYKSASVEEALNHPRWNMGKKITIDSATLFNKGLEVIEAVFLFNFDVEKIDVVIHPQSYVHGMVELIDNSFVMHVSPTDMKIPIMYALTYPDRKEFNFYKMSIFEISKLEFFEVDSEKFRSIEICREVAKKKGAYIPALLGADEEAVSLFLSGHISLPQISYIVEDVLEKVDFPNPSTIEDMLHIVEWARSEVRRIFSLKEIRSL